MIATEFARQWQILGLAVDRQQRTTAANHAAAVQDLFKRCLANGYIYKGSYTGLFKHLIDFLHPEALVGKPTLLAATGGSDRHALVEALKMSNWVQKDAAELLSISPRVMNYKIKTLGIEFPRGRRLPPADSVAAAS